MKYKYMTSVGVIGIVLFTAIMSIITPDKEISDLEGRELQKLPTPSKIIDEGFNRNAYLYETLTGTMFKKWDSYFSDHIYKRDYIVDAYTGIQANLDKKYVNGAYLGKDDYVFSPSTVMGVSNSELKDSAEHFNKIADKFKDSKTYLVNLPQKNMVYEDKLPINNYKAPENTYVDEFIDGIDQDSIGVLDFRSVISSDEELFYKTDHHWNMNGTYKAYNYIIDNINKDFSEVGEPKSKDYFDIDVYENYFIGTDGRKVGQLVKEGEDIAIYNSEDYSSYKVYSKDKDLKLIHEEFLNEEKFNNDYMSYLGGDNPEVIVENPNSNNDLKVVMIGDSMDNPLVPLMASHFSKLYSYDLRHYKDDINKTIEELKPDIIMFIGLSHNFIEGQNSDLFRWNIEN